MTKEITLTTVRSPFTGDDAFGKRWRYYFSDNTGIAIAHNRGTNLFEVTEFMHRGNDNAHSDVQFDLDTQTATGEWSQAYNMVMERLHIGDDNITAEFKADYLAQGN